MSIAPFTVVINFDFLFPPHIQKNRQYSCTCFLSKDPPPVKKGTVFWSRSHSSNRVGLGFEHGSLNSQSRASFFYFSAVKCVPSQSKEVRSPGRTQSLAENQRCFEAEPGTWEWKGLSARYFGWPASLPWFWIIRDGGRWGQMLVADRSLGPDVMKTEIVAGLWGENKMEWQDSPSLLVFLHYLRFLKWSHHRPRLQARKKKQCKGWSSISCSSGPSERLSFTHFSCPPLHPICTSWS